MTATTTFTDSCSDTLKVRNWTGVPGHGDLYIEETNTKKGYSFDLTPELSKDIAKTLVAKLDKAHVLEGILPDVVVTPGSREGRRVVCGAVSSSISESDAAYMEGRARRHLALALSIRRVLADDNKKAEEERAAAKALEERKNALAVEFSNGFYRRYCELALVTRKAIDAVITLEDR